MIAELIKYLIKKEQMVLNGLAKFIPFSPELPNMFYFFGLVARANFSIYETRVERGKPLRVIFFICV